MSIQTTHTTKPCESGVLIKVDPDLLEKSSDHHLPALPMIMRVEHVHNHPITGNPKVMQHQDVSEETIQKFKDLFVRGQTPASALKMHKLNLHMKHTTNYKYLASDRLVCPDLSFVYRLYAKVFKKRDGADSENSVIPEELTTLKMRFHNFVASVEKQLNENKNE